MSKSNMRHRLSIPHISASRVQVSTYFLGVCLPSIAFLVFLNASVSFVVTARIGQRKNIGDAVGMLGFADECVALIACTAWGVLSDRVGVRAVAVAGFVIIATALAGFVQAQNVVPQLLLWRLWFSLGGAAVSTMVTAILPSLTYGLSAQNESTPNHIVENGHSHAISPSVSSELTITPARLQSEEPSAQDLKKPRVLPSASSSQLAGFVGMFTGLGALIALAFFLPLPAKLQEIGETASQSLADSFYIVAVAALLVASIDFLGLRNLPGEERKGWKKLFQKYNGKEDGPQTGSAGDHLGANTKKLSYLQQIIISVKLGFTDSDIGLGYLAGFIARASSIAISLFIPLFVNAYFISSGQCSSPPEIRDPDETKQHCRRAYILAAILTGTSQLVALLAAPIYGYVLSRFSGNNSPILFATLMGVFGYAFFGITRSPDPNSDDGTYAIYLLAAMIGLSQIGTIVGSLSLISRGVQKEEDERMFHKCHSGEAGNSNHSLLGRGSQPLSSQANALTSDVSRMESTMSSPSVCVQDQNSGAYDSCNNDRSRVRPSPSLATSTYSHESEPLLSSTHPSSAVRRSISLKELNGSIAGVYSFSGGAGILILTKLGGSLFDSWTPAAPLYFMAIANGVLFLVTIVVSMYRTKNLKGRIVEGSEN